jgi:iron complex transport system ATP-binding protein
MNSLPHVRDDVPGGERFPGGRPPVPMPEPLLLELDAVSVIREGKTLLDRVSLVIPAGRHTAVLGPNGAGKTTLLRLLLRDYHPSVDALGRRGGVRILGRDDWNIADLRRRMGVVSSSLDDDFSRGPSGRLTVVEAVRSGFTGSQVADEDGPQSPDESLRVEAAIELCDAASLRSRRLETLSTGERRRTLIARALVHRPELLVLDEPTSGLDPAGREAFLGTLERLCREPGLTVLLVTHHLEEILSRFGHVVLLERGRVAFDGPAREGLEPHRLAALFSGSRESGGAGAGGGIADEPARKSLEIRLLETLERLEPFLGRDPLTGVRSRLGLDAQLTRAVEAAEDGPPLALAMLDIDRLGMVNARHGHRAGDQCLRQLTAALEGHLRETDSVFRYGGDEFLLLMPSTPPDEAAGRMERLRAGLAAMPLVSSGVPLDSLTVSIGIAGTAGGGKGEAPTPPPDAAAGILLKAAAAAMYRAKEAGGNRVVVAGWPGHEAAGRGVRGG